LFAVLLDALLDNIVWHCEQLPHARVEVPKRF
jgi:hypothetical protein